MTTRAAHQTLIGIPAPALLAVRNDTDERVPAVLDPARAKLSAVEAYALASALSGWRGLSRRHLTPFQRTHQVIRHAQWISGARPI